MGQRFSHVYSRPTQPLQDSQRVRRRVAPLIGSMRDLEGLSEDVIGELGVEPHPTSGSLLPAGMTCTSSSVTTPSTSRPTKRGAPHHVAAADVGERLHLADLYEHCFPRVPAHRDSAPQKLARTLDAA